MLQTHPFANPTLMMSINQLLAKFRNGQQNVIPKTKNLPRRFVVDSFLGHKVIIFPFPNEPAGHDLWQKVQISFLNSANQMFSNPFNSHSHRNKISIQIAMLVGGGILFHAGITFRSQFIGMLIVANCLADCAPKRLV